MLQTASSEIINLPLIHYKVVAAIPCLNTQAFIAEVVARAKKYVDEVIVIDDGSTDMTAEVANLAGATVISHEKNLGKGAAMKTALSYIDADIIVFIDGDGQHNPEEIPYIIEPITHGKADFVIGSRYLNGSKCSYNPFIRRTSNAIASLIISFIISDVQPIARLLSRISSLGKAHYSKKKARFQTLQKQTNCRILNGKFKWVTDCTSGFTAMRKVNCNKFNLVSSGFQIETEMIFEQAKNEFIIAEVPISCKWSKSVSKLSIINDGLRTFLLLIRKLIKYSQDDTQSINKLNVANYVSKVDFIK